MLIIENTGNGLDTVRNYISDAENFRQVINLFEKNDERKFIFNITMQNHGDYKYGGDNLINLVDIKNFDDEEMEQYMTLLKISDDALKDFIEYFKQHSDKKTIILFFGDHMPYIERIEELCNKSELDEEILKFYKIPFFIWANYDIEEGDVGLISSSYMSVVLKEKAGIPLNSWDLFRKDIYNKYPAFSLYGGYDSSNNFVSINEILNDEDMKKYEKLQYYFIKDEN